MSGRYTADDTYPPVRMISQRGMPGARLECEGGKLGWLESNYAVELQHWE